MQALNNLSDSFESLAEYVGPSTVQIFSTGFGPGDGSSTSSLITVQRSTGSGVIIDPDGYIVTNAHVIDGASAVYVVLPYQIYTDRPIRSILKPSGRQVRAEVIGIDLETDLAVLKIAATNMPALELGDSDNLRQGQIVLAFGSPLGLQNSASMGVISSVARQLRQGDRMVYIQTDAPINPGNSGGPLLDTEGKVIGINTLIFSQSGGSEGIGFAAPSNIVKAVFEQIRLYGRVRRGQIGVHAQTITPVLATALTLPRQFGVIISDVFPGGPASKAGLQTGDIILTMNDKPMENGRQFDVNLYQRTVGDKVRLAILRGMEELSLTVDVIERPDDTGRFMDMVDPTENLVQGLGVLAIDINRRIAERLPPLRKRPGVLIAAVAGDSPATEERLQPGDIIYSLNGSNITSLSTLKSIIGQLESGASAAIHLERQGRLRYVSFTMK